MNEEAQQKLDHIFALVAKLKAVEKEIEEALAPERMLDSTEPKESTKRKYIKKEKEPGKGRGKGPRHCKSCGEAGHRSDHCPRKESEEAPKSTTESTTEELPNLVQKPPEPKKRNSDVELTLSNVKILVDNGVGDEDIAKKLNLTVSTVKTYRSKISKEGKESFKSEDHKDRTDILSPVDFKVAKEMLGEVGNNSPVKIANELGLHLSMINEIIRAKGYDSYAAYVQSKNRP